MPIALLPVILQLVQAGITIAPSIIAAGKIELDLLRHDAPPPTASQKTDIDTALDQANAALQNAQPAP
jgi:hypothetical protein